MFWIDTVLSKAILNIMNSAVKSDSVFRMQVAHVAGKALHILMNINRTILLSR